MWSMTTQGLAKVKHLEVQVPSSADGQRSGIRLDHNMILISHQVLTGVFVQVSREALNSFTIIPDDLWYHCSISSHFPTPLLSQLGNILSGWCGCHFYSYSLAQLSECGLCFRVSLFVHHDNNSFSLSCAITSLNTIHHFLSHALYPWSPDLSLYSWEWNNQYWQWQDGRDIYWNWHGDQLPAWVNRVRMVNPHQQHQRHQLWQP